MPFSHDIANFCDALASGVVLVSPEGILLHANAQARRMLGCALESAAQADAFFTECGDRLAAEEHPVVRALRTGKPSGWVLLGVQCAPGLAPSWMRMQAVPVYAEAAAVEYCVVSLEDASDLRALRVELDDREQRLKALGSAIPVSSSCGRRAAHAQLAHAVVEARERGLPLAVCLLDLDMFKRINQAFGRGCGDEVLLHVAESLGEHLGPDALFSRIGGGEFLVVLPGAGVQTALESMDTFRERLASSVVPCTGRSVTISGGLVSMHADEDAPALLERADSLLYLAKLDGRNRIVADAAGPA